MHLKKFIFKFQGHVMLFKVFETLETSDLLFANCSPTTDLILYTGLHITQMDFNSPVNARIYNYDAVYIHVIAFTTLC